MQSTSAGPSHLHRRISGSIPGQLDFTQPDRLLRVSGSTLSFASFHPLTASPGHDNLNHRKPSVNEELYRPKRVVVERQPGPHGGSTWRFVPRARWAPGVESEGPWPRVIDICGESIHCSEDQWDIYKLDPAYDCFVDASPRITTISKKDTKQQEFPRERPILSTAVSPATPRASKHRLSSPSADQTPTGPPNKRFRSHITISSDTSDEEGKNVPDESTDDEEDEVEEIIVDKPPTHRTNSVPPGKHGVKPLKEMWKDRQAHVEEERNVRREKLAARTKKFTDGPWQDQEMIDLTMESDSSPQSRSQSAAHAPPDKGPSPMKRKASPVHESNAQSTFGFSFTGLSNGARDDAAPSNKRARMVSPGSIKREMQEKQKEREKKKIERYKGRAHERSEWYHENINQEIMADVPDFVKENTSAAAQPPPSPSPTTQEMDEEAQRQAAIEESRRKMAELEKDRPLWEEAARRREAEQRAAEEARRVRVEQERRRAAEAEEKRRRDATRARAEQARREAYMRAEREREQERMRRKQQQTRFSYGPWTPQRALERYKLLCESFDAAKFTTTNPVSFQAVPWPVLLSPATFTVADVDWSAVEAFFRTVKALMRSQDYKTFIEKSHKRFHPDRWRARGVLKSLEDDQLRDCLDVAANTVAQALTPLWREVKDG